MNWQENIMSEPTGLGELLQSNESKQHDSRVGLRALEGDLQRRKKRNGYQLVLSFRILF